MEKDCCRPDNLPRLWDRIDRNRLLFIIYTLSCYTHIRCESTMMIKTFPYLWDRVCSIFNDAGKFCLAHGLRQLTRDTKSDVSCLQTLRTRRNEKLTNDVRS